MELLDVRRAVKGGKKNVPVEAKMQGGKIPGSQM